MLISDDPPAQLRSKVSSFQLEILDTRRRYDFSNPRLVQALPPGEVDPEIAPFGCILRFAEAWNRGENRMNGELS